MKPQAYLPSPELQAFLNKIVLLFAPVILVSAYYIHTHQAEEDLEYCYAEGWSSKELAAHLAGLIITPFMLSNILIKRLDSIAYSFQPILPDFLISDPILKRMRKIVNQIDNLDPEIMSVQVCKLLQEKAAHMQNAYIAAMNDQLPDLYFLKKAENYAGLLEFVLKIYCSKPKSHFLQQRTNLNPTLIRINDLLKNFSPAIATRLKDEIISRLISNIIENKKLPITPFCLHGAPGTGKTWFVTTLCAELDIPYVNVKLHELKLISNPYNPDQKFDPSSVHPLVSLLAKMANQGKSTGVFFIDEVDKTFRGAQPHSYMQVERFLLDLLNANIKELLDEYTELAYDVTKIMIILGCNVLLTEIDTRFAPIQDRMEVVLEFANFTQKQKLSIVMQNARQAFAQQQFVLIRQDTIAIKERVARDTNPGVRQLLLQLTTHLQTKNQALIFSGTIWDHSKAKTIQTAWRAYRSRKETEEIGVKKYPDLRLE